MPVVVSVFGLLQFALTARASLCSRSEGFGFGFVGGLLRALLLLSGIALTFAYADFVRAFGVTLKGTSAAAPPLVASLGLLAASVGGPLLTVALLVASYRRFRDVPAMQEERLRRPFDAWLPPSLLDALNLVIGVGTTLIAEP